MQSFRDLELGMTARNPWRGFRTRSNEEERTLFTFDLGMYSCVPAVDRHLACCYEKDSKELHTGGCARISRAHRSRARALFPSLPTIPQQAVSGEAQA